MTSMHSLPVGTLPARSPVLGTPLKPSPHTCRRHLEVTRPAAISAPERLHAHEEAELQHKDAFAELVALSKQSVNRPQKVGIWRQRSRQWKEGARCKYLRLPH
jgi:hypothetical protein